jgi:hypothetical protein
MEKVDKMTLEERAKYNQLGKETDRIIRTAVRHLKQKGKAVKLPRKGQWTTLAGYCEKYNIEGVDILEG